MRAELGETEEDDSLPWLSSEAPSIEVAANFTGIYRILMSEECPEVKTRGLRRYQSTSQKERAVPVWLQKMPKMRAAPRYVRRVSLLLLRVINS
jgi:hypothetical protein